MSGNPLVRFDEGRVGRTFVSPSLLLYRSSRFNFINAFTVSNKPGWLQLPLRKGRSWQDMRQLRHRELP